MRYRVRWSCFSVEDRAGTLATWPHNPKAKSPKTLNPTPSPLHPKPHRSPIESLHPMDALRYALLAGLAKARMSFGIRV